MDYKRDTKGISRRRKEQEFKRSLRNMSKHIRPIHWLFIGIGILCFITLIYFGTDVLSNPDVDALSTGVLTQRHTKHQVVAEMDAEKEIEQAKESNSSNTTGDTTVSGAEPTLGQGTLIADTNKNPAGIPMYDGYTHAESDASFYVDYSRFWSSGDSMNGLGDWTVAEARNAISREFSTDSVNSGAEGTKYLKRMSDPKVIGGYWTAEGRIAVALPPGAIIDPSIYEPMIPTVWANVARYNDHSSWTKGAPALSYVANIFDNSLIGMHVDCVLADGSVIPFIITDTKALHTGVYNGTDLCQDNLLKGYAHWRGYASNGKLSYMSILEVATSSAKRSSFDGDKHKDFNLVGNKITGFKCYPATKGRFQ